MERQRRYNEKNEQVPALGVSDLMRYFIAGHLYVDPDVSNEQLAQNIASEFGIGDQDIMVFGQKRGRNIWVNQAASDELSQRFGGKGISRIAPLDEHLSERGF